MRRTLAIAKKELAVYLTTPLAWIVFTAVSFITSAFFLALIYQFKAAQEQAKQIGWDQLPTELRNLTDGVIAPLWSTVLVITLFIAPFLSMRLFAEERRQKTMELLLTAPVRSIEIVLGKFLGGLGIVLLSLGVTIAYPIILSVIGFSESGNALEWSTVLLGYLAMLLWGATCMSIGMFISSLTESQMLAAVVSFAIALGWLLMGAVAQRADEPVRALLQYLAFDQQLQGLLKGVLDLKPLVFFASIIAFMVLLTHRSVEARRWT